MKKCILGIICAILVIAFANSCNNATKTNANANDTTAVDSVDSLDSEVKNGWNYDSYADEMDGSTTKQALVVSSNVVEFDFPYNGGSTLCIGVCHRKKFGTNVMIMTSNGQFSANEFNGTNYVTIRFDEDAPIKFSILESSDGSSDILFLENPKKFIRLAKKAKTIKVEAPFFRDGWRVFTFNTNKPLEW